VLELLTGIVSELRAMSPVYEKAGAKSG